MSGVAVVGCGYWGRNLVRNFAQLRALSVICDPDTGRLATQASLYPDVRATTVFEDVLRDPAIDAVVIAAPAAMHHTLARDALQADKDVFVEKPLALRHEEGAELVELAETRGRILMVGHILEYHPALVLLRQLIEAGELGSIRYIYSNRLNLGKVRQEENILWSFAPHDISAIVSLLGAEPVSVGAVGGTYLQPGIVDVTVTNLLFPEGVRAHIFVSWLHPSKEQKFVVIGDRKMAIFDDTVREGKLKIYDKGIEWRAGLPVPRQTAETTLFIEGSEPLRLECEHFLSCVARRERPRTDGVAGLRVLRILEGAQTSLERGGVPVELMEMEARQPA